jgi:hypothetical protein
VVNLADASDWHAYAIDVQRRAQATYMAARAALPIAAMHGFAKMACWDMKIRTEAAMLLLASDRGESANTETYIVWQP